jgi:hypothetical protein
MAFNIPDAERVSIIHEGRFGGTSRLVLLIETNIQLNPQEADFDHERLMALTKAAQAMQSENRQVDHYRIAAANNA